MRECCQTAAVEWVQEIFAFIQGIAWPIVILVAVFLLRDELRTLVGRLTGVTGPGGIGASFERDARELPTGDEADLAQPAVPAVGHEGAPDNAGSGEATQGNGRERDTRTSKDSLEVQAIVSGLWDYRTEVLGRFADMQALSAQAPSAAVEMAWQEVRRALRKAEMAVGSLTGRLFYGQHPYLAVKELAGVPGFENLLMFADWAKELGNLAGRARREQVTMDAARSYVESADGFVSHYLGAVVLLLNP